MLRFRRQAAFAVVAMFAYCHPVLAQDDLESQVAALKDAPKRARIFGDPARGARLFYRSTLGCTQCHSAGQGPMLLGPDLAQLGDRATAAHIIESILEPSREIRDEYQVRQIVLANGQVLKGLVRGTRRGQIALLVPGEEHPRMLSNDNIEEQFPAAGLMPKGQVNQLRDLKEFYDLVSFLIAVGQGGPQRAAELRPAAETMAPRPLPAYEARLDHRGIIEDWDRHSLERGQRLYGRLCANCHGTHEQSGSLPNALRFAEGRFRNGADPLSIYMTLTHGYRMMLPQSQLVPQQKYDVIHFIREAFLKRHNPSQNTTVDEPYLASLPAGTVRGPEQVESAPWREMDYGPFLIGTYELVGPATGPRPVVTRAAELLAEHEKRPPPNEVWPAETNFAYKGIAVRLDVGSGGIAEGSHWLAFDHDTMRVAGAWSGDGFIDWEGILFNGRHQIAPRTIGRQHFANPIGPGWADPRTGSFEDPRLRGRDGRLFGPLPQAWASYGGLYKHGNRIVISYRVGQTPVLESYHLHPARDGYVWVRTLNVAAAPRELVLRVAPSGTTAVAMNAGLRASLSSSGGYTVVTIQAGETPVRIDLFLGAMQTDCETVAARQSPPVDLSEYTRGGPSQWPDELETDPAVGSEEDSLFAVDALTRPQDNPWGSRLRITGIDFFPDGQRLVACCWDGDVWIVSGIDTLRGNISWRRIASGLFQPLGVKLIDNQIFVGCRDQIVILRDLNADGEADFYECFNNDHQVTDHFHEFAMGLQIDSAGNLYYAKSARHARDSLVPQHGTLLRVSRDGRQTEILANGFRAANGVCLNPDGSFFVTDQEGHWHPMNRINRVVPGRFYGNMYSFNPPDSSSDEAMEQPVCWPNTEFDRSPSEMLWVESDAWGPLRGSLLSLSYGYGNIYVVPHEQVGRRWQGGMCRLPLPSFPTGIIRARFHPQNGQLYCCGMYAWASSQVEQAGGLYRVRYGGQPLHVPLELRAKQRGMEITFSDAVDRPAASDPENYLVETWTIKRTLRYGSDRYGERTLRVESATLSGDGRTVFLELPDIEPTRCMQIACRLRDHRGVPFTRVIQNTVHALATE